MRTLVACLALAIACTDPVESSNDGGSGGSSGAAAGTPAQGGASMGGAPTGGSPMGGTANVPNTGGSPTGGVGPQGGTDPQGGVSGSAGTSGGSGAGAGVAGTASGGSSGASGGGAGGAGAGGTAGSTSGAGGSGGAAGADPNFYIFLLIGQSNMEGMPSAEAADRTTNARVKVLAYDNCTNLGRTYNQWYTAAPPLHSCFAGVGPGDYFARTIADQYPTKTIGLVPCAISGVDVAFFQKGVVSTRRNEFRIPPDNHFTGAYEFVIERARLAQRSGVIKGILFHQGESDNGQAAWVGKVAGMVNDLRTDLGLGNVPFLAGELLYSGCCAAHNPVIAMLPGQITNASVISAMGLNGVDEAHFDLAGQRTFGQRYGERMIQVGGF